MIVPFPAECQELVLSSLTGEKMARREWQNPSILERSSSAGPEWYIRYRVKVMDYVDGKPGIRRVEKWRALGLCSEITKRQAEREKDKIMREVNQQVYTVQSQVPFLRVLQAFSENHIPTLAPPSQATYKQHIHAYIEPAFKGLRLCEVGTMQVEQLFQSMEKNGLSRNTRKTTKGILKAIFGCAKRWKCTDAPNPVKDADVGGGARAVRPARVPSLADVGRLLAACEGDVPLLIETLYTTGMRISEAAGLTVSDLDFGAGFVCVSRRDCRGSIGDTKSNAGTRDLPMGQIRESLRVHVAGKQPGDRVFTWKGAPIVDNTLLADYLTPVMESLGIKFPGFGWHTFRRLHISAMSRSGLSLFELREQAGHADIRTTQRYIVNDKAGRAKATKDLPRLVVVTKKKSA